MNYKLVYDEVQVERFFNLLPVLEKNELYTTCIFARKKYLTEQQKQDVKLNVKDSAIDRIFVTSTWDFTMFLNRLRKYEVAQGCYLDRNNNGIPDNCLSLYSDVNPRCGVKALGKFMHEVTEDFFRMDPDKHYSNVISRLKSKVQGCASRKIFADIDIDTKDHTVLREVMSFVKEQHYYCAETIETRGGYHMLIDMERTGKIDPRWYPNLQKYLKLLNTNLGRGEVIEFKTDTMAPIPGTIQGGFEVKFIKGA